MGRLAVYNEQALAELLRRQDGVIGRAQAVGCAMTDSAIRHRIRQDGPWQVVLPGVYLRNRGTMTVRQRNMAAFVYAGRGTGGALAVSGAAALAWHGIPVGQPGPAGQPGHVDVLVRPSCRLRDAGFVRLRVTSAELAAAYMDGALQYAPPARAVVDAVRQLRDPADVRAVVAASVQRGKVYLWQLAGELEQGPAPGSAGLRQALAEVAEGVRSSAEGDLLSLVKRGGLPLPLLNPRLYIGTEFLAAPDAYWPDAGVAAEADSREWHLSPAHWEQTMVRHARMSARGIIVLHYPPSRIRKAGREVVAEIGAALAAPGRCAIPGLRVLPSR